MSLRLEYADEFGDVIMGLPSEEAVTWRSQSDLFFKFLLAQGFILSEHDLATHFYEVGNDMRAMRSNHQTTPVIPYAKGSMGHAMQEAERDFLQQEHDEEAMCGNYRCGCDR